MTFDAILKDLKAGKYNPVYFLCGEETYYIDQISDYIEKNVLTDDEKEFNQTILYGLDVSAEDVKSVAGRYPMMSRYQVVILKEAQLMRKIDALGEYIAKPQESTILVICYKGKTLDKRTNFATSVKNHTVYLESTRLKEDKIPEWFTRYVEAKGYKIKTRAAIMVAEAVGNDLEKLTNEAEKLFIRFAPGYEITEKDVELLVGISREYNVFELQKALGMRDVFKANQIAFYMANNPKNYALPATLALLYGYFSKILLMHYLKSKGERELAKAMGVPPFFLRDYETAGRQYSPAKLIKIMRHLRDYDLKSKGVNNESADEGSLLKELVFKIVH